MSAQMEQTPDVERMLTELSGLRMRMDTLAGAQVEYEKDGRGNDQWIEDMAALEAETGKLIFAIEETGLAVPKNEDEDAWTRKAAGFE